ncbi:MAG: WcaI family glycosyltransferase [Thiotrichales bacterium]|jgi:colanic acid biosynthesis glycosyl transferase WcaI|nr:WcaI family glycosyltransferase [Thiotrichales bacterium]
MQQPNITLIGVNFFPEDTAIGLYTSQWAQYLSDAGCEVTVVTGFPYYPQWKIRADYQDKSRWLSEDYHGVRVLRYKQYVPEKPSFVGRVWSLLTFTLGSIVNLFKVKQADLVICVVPFTSSILLGWLLAKVKGAKLWVHVQDFEFDAVFDAGILSSRSLKGRIIGRVVFALERFLLNRADQVSTISSAMMQKLQSKTRTPAFYFPNWVDVSNINPNSCSGHPYLQSERFKVLYSGNIGEKQDWDSFVVLVKHFQHRQDIEFIIVGEGAKKAWLQTQLIDSTIVSFYDPVPYAELNDLLCGADVHILLQKVDVLDSVMPSKILGMMASAKPSLISGHQDSEVKRILEAAQAGCYVDDIDAAIQYLEKMIERKSFSHDMGNQARHYVESAFSKSSVLLRFKQQLDALLKGAKA